MPDEVFEDLKHSHSYHTTSTGVECVWSFYFNSVEYALVSQRDATMSQVNINPEIKLDEQMVLNAISKVARRYHIEEADLAKELRRL